MLQIVLGLPFLMHAPRSYIVQAFDFSRYVSTEMADDESIACLSGRLPTSGQ